MNIGLISCLIMSGFFAFLGVLFLILKEKGAMLISGFNSLSKEERDQYDQVQMSKDQRNSFLVWAGIFAVGAVTAYFISQYTAIVAFAIWLVLFLKELHFDRERAFAKYRK